MLRSYVSAKIHGVRVTAASVEYHGSVTIAAGLLEAAGIEPYERVFVVNLGTGARWDTYALPGTPGVFTLNGGSARLGVPGDPCVIMTYALAESAPGAAVVFCGEANEIASTMTYPAAGVRILELGSYVVPAYAAMILAEQGHEVTKWTGSRPDPILGLRHGDDLWAWINHGKTVEERHAATVEDEPPGRFDAVIDNIRAATWEKWGVDPGAEAERLGVRWVSMRDDLGGRSFDAIAQARAWGDHVGYVPAYLGDTTGGLWLAFKLLTAPPGHHVLHQAACLAKLVEGELQVTPERDGLAPPWDEAGTYGRDGDGVTVIYRGERCHEPFRDDSWRLANLRHDGGRIVI